MTGCVIFPPSHTHTHTHTHTHLPSWLGLQNTLTAFLQRSKNPPPTNKCLGYDPKQFNGKVPVMLELWGMQSMPSLPLLLGPLWPGVVAPDRVLSLGQIGLNCVLVLNCIAWNRTVLTFKLRTYAKLICLKWKCFCMLNWIVWTGTIFDI